MNSFTMSRGTRASQFLVALIISVMSGVVFADNPQCKSCSDSVASNGNLVVAYDISGLGGTTEAGFVLTATVTGDARCVNKGQNCPEAANKFGPVDLGTSGVLGVHNGRARGTATLSLTTGVSCPKGQTATLVDVQWTNVVFTVEGTAFALADVNFNTGKCS